MLLLIGVPLSFDDPNFGVALNLKSEGIGYFVAIHVKSPNLRVGWVVKSPNLKSKEFVCHSIHISYPNGRPCTVRPLGLRNASSPNPRAGYVDPLDIPQRLAQGLRQYFPYHGPATCVSVRHGYLAWPIEVVGHHFANGWPTFRKLHGLKILQFVYSCIYAFVLVFGFCSRNLSTSCLPSLISAVQSVMKFGHLRLPGQQLHHEFKVRLKEVFRVYNLEEMVIKMANRTCAVPIDNLHLDAQTFIDFLAVL
ncbi:hypothetical protein RHGRI_037286 [Rhododendron griersonianum]|uniref:Uncharacterized protein n=1 Tax=Rhododendron griersonianum TaxID=479676 RepID=A0AAV6HR84_9ERIC|nr:hypothetical protein RHGRI_037286 [Rhododendron griersonianum]